MNKAVLRQWAMLRLIPRYPRKTSAPEIHRGLERLGHESTLRTVQRDLNALALTFPLLADDAKPQGWSWAVDAPQLSVPNIDEHAAMSFLVAQMHLDQVFPKATMDYLAPWFKEAGKSLTSPLGKTVTLHDKVRVINRGLRLRPPTVDRGVVETVYAGLLLNRQINVSYKARVDQKSKEYQIDPLVLVMVDSICYLVVRIGSYEDLRHLALHRIHRATLSETSIKKRPKINLDEYISSAAFALRLSDRPINLKFRMVEQWAFHLLETPLSDNQTHRSTHDGWIEFSCSILDSQQLRWWIRGFGPDIVIESPRELRSQVAQEADRLQEHYATSP
jgi:predicted DNA-binding transcriptional regulator YafY